MSSLKYAVEPEAADGDAERRIAPRTKTLKRAKVYFNNMHSTFDCIVRNISATGALLTLDDAAHLPREFDVRIGEEKTLRTARLVYRRGMLAGIHFLNAPPVVETTKPALAEDAPSDHDLASKEGVGIRRMMSERLPRAVTKNVRWF